MRRVVRDRYRYILVDEFQDTDPLQLHIVRLLAEDESTGEVLPGKLFFVGDPRQSIYRFRRADPALYERALADLVPSGAKQLTQNFRSRPVIIDWVNAVFGRLFAQQGENEAARYAALEKHRPSADDERVVILGRNCDLALKAGERRRTEAEEIAATINAAVRDGWSVGDDPRAARFGDIVVLVPRRTGLAELEAAFDHRDIPFRADSPSLILKSAEVRDLLACLRAVDSPGDEVALIAALRTPLLACGDDDLLRFRRAGGRWALEADQPVEAEDPVRVAIGRLAALATARHRLGITGTLEEIVRRLHVVEISATTRHPEESLRRLRYLIERAYAFAAAGGTSIAEFLGWIEGQVTGRAGPVEMAVGNGDDLVRILTIHTAKGLEFPVVVLAELGGDPSRQRIGDKVLFADDGHAEIGVRKGVETPGYAELFEEETRQADLESIRLCYVGMTRARDHLVVSLHRSKGSATRPSIADLLAELLPSLGAVYVEEEMKPAPYEQQRLALAPRGELSGPAMTKEGYAKWRIEREALLAGVARRRSIAASQLDEDAEGEPRALGDEPDERARWRSPRAASAIGRAVHGVLQRIDLASGAALDELVSVEAKREGCLGDLDTVRERVRRALSAPSVISAAAAGRCYRELPVSVAVGGGVLDGVIDLAYFDGDRLVAIDYKTDVLTGDDDVVRATARYRRQAGAYAFALAQILGRPVDRFAFVFLSPEGGAVESEVTDLEQAIDEARAAIESALSDARR